MSPLKIICNSKKKKKSTKDNRLKPLLHTKACLSFTGHLMHYCTVIYCPLVDSILSVANSKQNMKNVTQGWIMNVR